MPAARSTTRPTSWCVGGQTGHAEVVQVEYDPARVSYDALLDVFWDCHDPTQLNRQGPDIGRQYRTAIFTHDDEQMAAATASKARLEESHRFRRPIMTEITPLGTFWRAEDYHQQYLEKRGLRHHALATTVAGPLPLPTTHQGTMPWVVGSGSGPAGV